MSERKITAPGPGWRMPGRAKSTNISDAMPNLLNAMGDSIERSNKMDFGTPGVHTQNGFQQPHETTFASPIWVLLTSSLPAGSYDSPSSASAKLLVRNSSIGENSLVEGTEDIVVINYSQSFSATSGDWTMAMPFGDAFVVIPSGGSRTRDITIDFYIDAWVYDDAATVGCDAVYATVTQVSCESENVAVGDQVIVFDTNMCWFNLPVQLLVGTNGWAQRLESTIDAAGGECFLAPVDGECLWQVRGLCCREELYGV